MTAVKNVKWVAVAQAAKIISQLANIFVLARILPPSDYGVMAIATVASNLALLIRDMGTASNVIQKSTIDHPTINAVFWLNVVMGLSICMLLVLFAPYLGSVFRSHELTFVLWIIAPTFLISSSSAIHQALLERESKFKLIAGIEGFGALLAITVSITAALFGFGVYSLAFQVLVQALSVTLLLWYFASWMPTFNPQFSKLKELMHFSANMAGYQMVSFAFRNADAIIIGRFLNSALLGVYSMAYKIMLFPIQNISWITTRAIFPLLSRAQDNMDEVRRLYLSAIMGVSFLTAPLMMLLFVTRVDFIQLALGEKWNLIPGLLTYMTAIGYLQAISGTTGPVFMALGKTSFLFKFGIFGALLHILLFVFGAKFGIVEVVQCYLLACLIVTLLTFYFAHKTINLSLKEMLPSIGWSLVCSIFSGLISLHLMSMLIESPTLVRFIIVTLVFLLLYLAMIFKLSPDHFRFVKR
ncbi:lipopolysaccharide biosynthesis protein [Methylophilus sp. QUAN]|uniref:lipopolysaccharide biosynthesis protein n=1 Tax=Methylophilus sp. QUAN TaxID=2781020 RepID=UPI00188EA89F|nr:lipopolysaccharide biosynthesis protein [Methylophilus sp. QUAN]MBF4991758.1 lipopolysaccharide biosynthesis protein [Methylophilus sp. QUAN]